MLSLTLTWSCIFTFLFCEMNKCRVLIRKQLLDFLKVNLSNIRDKRIKLIAKKGKKKNLLDEMLKIEVFAMHTERVWMKPTINDLFEHQERLIPLF